jgi:Secretory lipase
MKSEGVMFRRIGGVSILVATLGAGCSSSDTDETPAAKPDPRLAVQCTDSIDVFYERPADLPAFDASRRGDVVRCGEYGKFTLDELKTTATSLYYEGAIMKTGVSAYRVAYRTQRSTRADGTTPDGVASATLFLPDKPRVADGPVPLLVVAHGTIGIGGRCAPSRGELTVPGDHLDDYRATIIPLVAAGWIVISPDFPGYGYGETTGYMDAEDAAHGVLDATRAASKVLAPGVLSGKVAFVGHSQGGHAVLSAHAYEPTYGMEGTLEGVATMAPLWFSPLAFAAMLSPIAGYNTTDSPYPLSYAMAYFYTHGENVDGPGHGTDMFQPDKRDLVRSIADGCLFEAGEAMPSLGEKPADFFDPDFVDSVGLCGLTGDCTDGDALVWGARCRTDRPEMNAHGAPILLWFGGLDPTISPGLAVCGLDNLRAGIAAASDATTSLKVCVDATAAHSGFLADVKDGIDPGAAITRRSMDWVDQWIAARTIGGEEPPACEGEEAFATESGPRKCSTPPPND